ncbi:adhesive plaque matrix protein-like [Xenia sp. Carnegie-2017]|uniref:adhesive plaque matrix protein-like n=1 Tax=Xenia sp. Carnegie-2017 TaxID=2897299 RepID=UPI001F03CB42|nr:adhesive plaque matrix protein-like [Xenia sp. Carnegie-2017]
MKLSRLRRNYLLTRQLNQNPKLKPTIITAKKPVELKQSSSGNVTNAKASEGDPPPSRPSFPPSTEITNEMPKHPRETGETGEKKQKKSKSSRPPLAKAKPSRPPPAKAPPGKELPTKAPACRTPSTKVMRQEKRQQMLRIRQTESQKHLLP